MALLYAVARTWEDTHPLWPWVRSFAEAGMVGAIADWFAVVALFKHPLGLPVPHTAIIPNKKNEIANNLAAFIQTHFLDPQHVIQRIQNSKPSATFASWISNREHAEMLVKKATSILPSIMKILDDHQMKSFIREIATSFIHKIPLTDTLSRALVSLEEKGESQALLDEALKVAQTLLVHNVDLVTDHLQNAVPGFVKKMPPVIRNWLIEHAAALLVQHLRKGLNEIIQDPQHPAREKFLLKLRVAQHQLTHNPAWQQKVETLKASILSNEVLLRAIENLWTTFLKSTQEDLKHPESRIIHRGILFCTEIGAKLQEDQALREQLDQHLSNAVHSILTQHGHQMGSLIRDTIHRWDGQELSQKLESQVGADLQFIRLNGTLVGGLVGLVLHALSSFFWS